MSNKRTKIFGNVRSSSRKACALALAATMALGVTPMAIAPAAFADNLGSSSSAQNVSGAVSSNLKFMSVSALIDKTVAQTAMAQMDDIASDVIEQAAKAEAEAKAKAKAEKASKVDKTLKVAKNLIGTPYVYGGSTPAGFDCSGFTMYCYAKAGISLTHNAQAQYNQTKSVSTKDMKKGDLVFFGSGTGSITHVGIYVGNGKFIHSPQTGEYVRIDSLSSRSNFVGATRPVK
mgnify:FL=1